MKILRPILMLAVVLILCDQKCFSQQDTVKQADDVRKSMFGFQIAPLGFAFYNEARLAEHFTLKSKLGMAFTMSYSQKRFNYALIPEITLSPRWYYNLAKRNEKGLKTINNAASYLAFQVKYYSDFFKITNSKYIFEDSHTLNFIPSWGLRRAIGKHFDFEFGAGIGAGIRLNQLQNNNKRFYLGGSVTLALGVNL